MGAGCCRSTGELWHSGGAASMEGRSGWRTPAGQPNGPGAFSLHRPATQAGACASADALGSAGQTPEQFERVCQADPEAVLELAADGHLIAMTPTGGETGARNLRLVHRLLLWADGAGQVAEKTAWDQI